MNGFEMRFRAAGNDYDAALERTAGDTELLGQLMLMFKSDGGFAALSKALEEDDCKAAFAAAHSHTGNSMSLASLYPSLPISEARRSSSRTSMRMRPR